MRAASGPSDQAHRVWWLGDRPTSTAVHWWCTYRDITDEGPGPVAAPAHGAVPISRLTELLRRLDSGLVSTAADPATARGATGPSDGQDAVQRAWRGVLADRSAEYELAMDLGRELLPDFFRRALTSSYSGAHVNQTVVVASGPSLAGVPFELLVVDPGDGLRLLEVARIRGGLSAAAGVGARRPAADPPGGTLRIIDPGPNRPAAMARGGVYQRGVPELIYPEALGGVDERWFDRHRGNDVLLNELETMRPITREVLSDALRAGPDRMLFLGHAVSGTEDAPAKAGLVMSDPESGGPYRPFTAAEWIRDPLQWPAPRKVAVVSCHSNDTHLHEQMGLVQAATHAGAALVTSTRWVLPADHTSAEAGTATTELALAIDNAHAEADPIAALRSWQLGCLQAWRLAPTNACAPLIWAAPVTYQRIPLESHGTSR